MLEAIAKASFISPFHFHRIFKSITNSTPREYMERIRIEKSRSSYTIYEFRHRRYRI
ncbi:MAG: AraC family transcriptional regulator [Leptospiraceae bacterium]|nr:AraC family transcriptional regulator [Leptospiraceae bacterium]